MTTLTLAPGRPHDPAQFPTRRRVCSPPPLPLPGGSSLLSQFHLDLSQRFALFIAPDALQQDDRQSLNDLFFTPLTWSTTCYLSG